MINGGKAAAAGPVISADFRIVWSYLFLYTKMNEKVKKKVQNGYK